MAILINVFGFPLFGGRIMRAVFRFWATLASCNMRSKSRTRPFPPGQNPGTYHNTFAYPTFSGRAAFSPNVLCISESQAVWVHTSSPRLLPLFRVVGALAIITKF